MFDEFVHHPGRLYVVAAMLPLLPAALILLAGAVKNLTRPAAVNGGVAAWVYRRLGGERPPVWGAYLSVACMAVVAVQGVLGVIPFLTNDPNPPFDEGNPGPTLSWPPGGRAAYDQPQTYAGGPCLTEKRTWLRTGSALGDVIQQQGTWKLVAGTEMEGETAPEALPRVVPDGHANGGTPYVQYARATIIHFGYSIDTLAAVLFAVVTVVAVAVFVFSLGYLKDERAAALHDHEAHAARRGRPGRYFSYVSLFVSAMLNLLLADNLLQIFVCWELVGACSFLLVGFYTERPTAAAAATKAFVVNRIGDAGFLVALAVAWSVAGTLDLTGLLEFFVLERGFEPNPSEQPLHVSHVIFGLGLFLGCVGKSAQVPLQVWLPDAMAGPTPVSALIHAATMVAAGVYLLIRCRWLFTPEVYLVIAYTGGVTMLLGATAACAQTDVKRILAYSTVSQLGLMVLGVGVMGHSGPAAPAFHLVTHAFFKALLFLAAGCVIHALGHEQDVRRMGGLRRRMPLTAVAMLVGVLAISGFPLTSGWYSKEAILNDAVYVALLRPDHVVLAVAPFLAAGLTAFYMFRLWFLVFCGGPRDPETFGRAQKPSLTMTAPLLVLTALSLCVGWGWPVWEPTDSFLGRLLADRINLVHGHLHWMHFPGTEDDPYADESWALPLTKKYHLLIEAAAGLLTLAGFAVAFWMYSVRGVVPAEPRGVRAFFAHAWYFDAVCRCVIVRPVVRLAALLAAADRRPGAADGHGSDPATVRPDPGTLDGWLNGVGLLTAAVGRGVRRAQLGYVRGYVLALGLTVVGLLGMLAVLNR